MGVPGVKSEELKKASEKAPLAVKILIPITGVLFASAAYLRTAVSTEIFDAGFSRLEFEEIVLSFIILTVAVFIRNKPVLFGGGLIVFAVFDTVMNGGRLAVILWSLAGGRNSSVSFPFFVLPLILRVLAFIALFVTAFHFTARGRGISVKAKKSLSATWVVLMAAFCALDTVSVVRNLEEFPFPVIIPIIAGCLGAVSAVLLGACIRIYTVRAGEDLSPR